MAMVKTSELEGAALDWAVGKADGREVTFGQLHRPLYWGALMIYEGGRHIWNPSTDWSQGGPLLSDYAVSVRPTTDAQWEAEEFVTHTKASAVDGQAGIAYLTAAMRVIVASEMGDEVEVPDELL